MERKKIIIYGVLVTLSVIISLIMLLSPEPGRKDPDITRTPKINVKNLDDFLSTDKSDSADEIDDDEETEKKYTFDGIKVQRDIFSSKLLIREEKTESLRQEKQKSISVDVRKPNFKILGTIIVDNDRSIILDTSEILNEGATKDGFFIMRILSDRVVLRGETGQIFEIDIWEEN